MPRRNKNLTVTLEREEFKSLMKQAGFKNRTMLAEFLNIASTTLYSWSYSKIYPKWIIVFLKTYKELKIYQNNEQHDFDSGIYATKEFVRAEIDKLRQEIQRGF